MNPSWSFSKLVGKNDRQPAEANNDEGLVIIDTDRIYKVSFTESMVLKKKNKYWKHAQNLMILITFLLSVGNPSAL